jgi:hypothetical protein
MPKTILKTANEIAMMMMMKPARTPAGKRVQAKVLAAVEIEIMCDAIVKGR